jgi:hypothetical protein
MMDAERTEGRWKVWVKAYALYEIARYNAVQAGYLPETPEFG